MSWSYDTSLSTSKDVIRLRVGDTNTSKQMLSNEEISAVLTDTGEDLAQAAVDCCEAIIAHLARDYDRSNVGMSASRSQQITHYGDLLKSLKAKVATLAGPTFGGTSVSDKTSIEDDSDYNSLPFYRGHDDNNDR